MRTYVNNKNHNTLSNVHPNGTLDAEKLISCSGAHFWTAPVADKFQEYTAMKVAQNLLTLLQGVGSRHQVGCKRSLPPPARGAPRQRLDERTVGLRALPKASGGLR